MSGKMQKLKNKFNEHKKELFIGAGAIVAVVGGVFLGRKILSNMHSAKYVVTEAPACKELVPTVRMEYAELVDNPWVEGNVVNMLLNDVKVGDLGNLGDDLKSMFDGLTDESVTSAVLCLDGEYNLA